MQCDTLFCSKCEIKLEGEEPWAFPGSADDLQIIYTPGHTYGHIVLLHKPSKCASYDALSLISLQRWLCQKSSQNVLNAHV